METPQVLIAQSLADEWALIAQRYAGFFTGHPTHAGQYGTSESGKVFVETDKAWTEPLVFEDGCEFCQITSDDRVRERILGFQAAINIETQGAKSLHLARWMNSGDPRVPNPGTVMTKANRRAFAELFQDVPTARRPDGWRLKPVDLTKLPFHLQKRLCIEWNHALRAWLGGQEALEYDFESRCLVIRGAKDGTQPLVAADEADLAVLIADQEADRVFAATLPTIDDLSLADQIAQEYELDV